MDRIDFTKSLKTNISPEKLIKEYFDEFMSLYNVIGEFDNFKMEGEFEEGFISFELKFKKKKDAKHLYDSVQFGCGRRVRIYNREFSWDFEHNGKTVLVSLV